MIVVGVDYSEDSRSAFTWALAEAAVRRDEVLVIHSVAPLSDLVLGTHEVSEIPTHARDALRRFVAQTMERNPAYRLVPIGRQVRAGHAADVIRVAADELEAAMIVVGRHGLGTFEAIFAGSVCTALTRSADRPLVVVPLADRPKPAHPSRVVVGVDGSEQSFAALRWAADEARRHHAQLLAVHAVSASYTYGAVYGLPEPDLPSGPEAARHLLQQALAKLEADMGESVDVENVIADGPSGRALRQLTTPDDLLVVGRSGQGGIARWLLGSTSRYVVEHAACPIAVVP